MALRQPLSQLGRRVYRSKLSAEATKIPWQKHQRRQLATPTAPPVTPNATSSKGPTAIVFMNMGGPSTTDEVGDFLSRLFVRYAQFCKFHSCSDLTYHAGGC
jgi:ferrochelatase